MGQPDRDPDATLPNSGAAQDAATIDLPRTQASSRAVETLAVDLADETALIRPVSEPLAHARASAATLPHGSAPPETETQCDDVPDRTDVKPPSAVSAAPYSGRLMGPAPAACRYRVMRPHARGGLGEVFVALDEELQREVALKEIQPRHANHQESRTRFLIEAEVTGGLEHPGIVPVYGLGRYQDGRPYYAMRFIRGNSLRKALEQHHADRDEPLDPGERELGMRQLLARFLDVCNAIHYAHCRGVLHRDLKPDNVMLGDFGETLVVDWGLAKTMEHADPQPGTGAATLSQLRPMSAGSGSFTMYGSALGTPQYMSPEQADGLLDQLGPATDIYSLGATLYHIVTGTVPFVERTIPSLLKAVREGTFVPPRQANREVPPALEAICMKAMALRPEDRYPTARALADDVEHWLADEPVSVFREPWTTRAWRWARRHKTLVWSTAALLVTAVIGLTIGTILVKREQARTEVQRQLAESNFRQARDAVDQMLTDLGEVELADVPQAESVRKKMLGKALEFYRRFLEQRRNDPSVQREAGRAATRLGDILEMLGNYDGAEAAYREGFQRLDTLARADPESRADLARAHHQFGILLRKAGRFRDADRELREAIRLRKELAATFPTRSDFRRDERDSLYHLGALLAKLPGRQHEAEDAYNTAIEEQKARLAAVRAEPDNRRKLAKYLNNLGMLVQARPGKAPEAERIFREALANQQALVEASPGVAGYQWELARTHTNLGVSLESQKFFVPAGEAFEAALARLKRLADDFPTVPDYPAELAAVRYNLARIRILLSHPKESEADVRDAISRLGRLVADFPGRPDYRQRLARAYDFLGVILRMIPDRLDAANASTRKALEIQSPLVQAHENVPEYRAALAGILLQRARLLEEALHRPREALPLVDEAGRHLHAALDGDPENNFYREYLANVFKLRALIYIDFEDHARAASELEALAKFRPDDPSQLVAVASSLVSACLHLAEKDPNLAEPKREEFREQYLRRGMALLKVAVEKGYRDDKALDGKVFDALREREDFRRLREIVKSRANPIVG